MPRLSTIRAPAARAALVAAISLGAARLAAAQPEPMALTWHAPAGCPNEARVVAEVGQNLAGSGALFAPFVAVVGVRGRTGGRWQASLLFQARDTRAERTFEAESCEAIASAAALVIALWAEGGADVAAPDAPPRPATAPAPFVPSAAKPPAEPAGPVITASPPAGRAPAAADVERSRWTLMMNWLVDRNTMPEAPALGIEAVAGRIWSGRRWRVRALGGLSYFPSQRTSTNPNVAPGDLQLLDISSRGCLTFATGGLEIGPCAGAELAVMHGSVDFGDLQDPTQVWLSLLGGALASWRVYPAVAIFARAEVVKPTAGHSFIERDSGYDGVGYAVPAIAGRGALGIELRFH